MDVRDLRPPVEDGPWPPPTHLPPLDHPPLRGARTWTGLTYAVVDGYRPMVLDLHVPTAVSSPMLLMHGDADSVSPVEQSVRFHEAALRVGAPTRLEISPGPRERAITFLQEHLRPSLR